MAQYGESEEDQGAREERARAEFERKYRMVKIGYVAAGALFTLSMLCFILGIMASSPATAGVGGIFLLSSAVTGVFTGLFHSLSGVWAEQQNRQ